MFVPVNVILFIPFIAFNYIKFKDKKIKQEDLFKKVFIIAIIAVIVLIGEYFYFKNIQNNVKQISQNVEEKQNITITNEQTNTNNQLNEEINSIINEL